jgi:5'-nucleotidase
MLDVMPDMVISGINAGANMGDDTIYSGTVAAATEGFLLGIPAIAISLAGKELAHYETAAKVAVELVKRFEKETHAHPWLLNVNVPDVAFDQLQGRLVTRLGKRHKAEPVIKSTNPRGETVYWVGAAGKAQDAGEGTDFHAIASNCVSITPLQVDLTQFGQLDAVQAWLGNSAS